MVAQVTQTKVFIFNLSQNQHNHRNHKDGRNDPHTRYPIEEYLHPMHPLVKRGYCINANIPDKQITAIRNILP